MYLQPFWGTDWYGSGIEIFSIEPGTQVLIDTTFNGPDSSDPVYHISAGDRLYIGDFPDISNFQVVTWKKNPLVIYSNRPIFVDFRYDTDDWGDYDDSYLTYASPLPGTRLVGVNVRHLYVTPTEKGTTVYVNGQNMGYIPYGHTLNVNFSTPQTVVVTANSPIVAVSMYIDPGERSRTYAFPLMPPTSGDFLIPNSVKTFAENRKALAVNEYYIVLDSQGNIIENQSLPSQPVVLHLTNSEVFVFRTFYYEDPWGDNAPRYAMSAQAVKPAMYSTLVGWIGPVNEHTVANQLRFYAESEVVVYKDYGADGSIDDVETLFPGKIYSFSDHETNPDKSMLIYVKGKISGYYTDVIGWSYQIEGAREMGTSPLINTNIPPVANFTFVPQTPQVNTEITFNASSSYDPDGSIVNYTWDFGDGTTAEGKVVTHSYSVSGIYRVTLTVTDNNGTKTSLTKVLVIQPILDFVPPTPQNGEVVSQSHIFINVSSNVPLKKVLLEWNGRNITMKAASSTSWYLNLTGLKSGIYHFRVWGEDEKGNLGVSDFRTVIVKLPETPAISKENAISSYNTVLTVSHLWTAWFFKYHDEFNRLYANASGVDNATLQKALKLHKEAMELMLKAWRIENLSDIQAVLWDFTKTKSLPQFWDIRKAFLMEREALKMLESAIAAKSS